jgi:ferredoxin--NADP+ reductase
MTGLAAGRVIAKRRWADGLATLTIEAEIEPFEPGQFVNLARESEGEVLRRAYSLASPPGAPLAFLVNRVDGGAFTPYLLSREPGDPLLVERKPQGFFTLRYVPPAAELWLVATGTGLGPFLSILGAGEALSRFERIVLVHGVREPSHFAHRAELEALEAAHPGRFKLIRAVTRAEATEGALRGRVTELLAHGALERAAELELRPERSHLMLCGNPAMAEEMLALLAPRGLVRHRVRKPGHVTIEKYW